jgi:hypothetical protein
MTEAAIADDGAATNADQQRALEEALDHLLDPLAEDDRPGSNGAAGEEVVRRALDPILTAAVLPVAYHTGPTVRGLAKRLRRRRRALFRISRHFAGWAVSLGAFWGLVWIILSVGSR